MSRIIRSNIFTNERIKKEYDLQKYLEDRKPLIVYPDGFEEYDGYCTKVGLAEGFIYPDGVMFFTTSWNQDDGSGYYSGSGPMHWLRGKVEEPQSYFVETERTCYGGVGWKVGYAIIIVPHLRKDKKLLPDLKDYLNLIRGKEKQTRAQAQEIADKEVEDMRTFEREKEGDYK